MTQESTSRSADAAPQTFRWLRRIAQALVVVIALFYLARLAIRHSEELGQVRLTIAYAPLLAASLLTLTGYLVNVLVWVGSLRWWDQHIGLVAALRIWFLSNLARFIPGVVWQFAGLAGMSYSAGLSPIAATGAILLQQVGLLCTGLVVALLLAPSFIPAWAAGLSDSTNTGKAARAAATWARDMPLLLRFLLGAAAIAIVVLLLPRAVRAAARLWERTSGKAVAMPRLTWRRTSGYLAALTVTWILYAVAFWLFGRALLGSEAPRIGIAAAACVTSYVAGIIVVLAPAGLGIRELVLYSALAPILGARNALLLSLLARVWLVAVEVVGALVVFSLPRQARPD
jgi:hypothetical protein